MTTNLTKEHWLASYSYAEYTGEVTPFRYCEIELQLRAKKESDIIRETVFYHSTNWNLTFIVQTLFNKFGHLKVLHKQFFLGNMLTVSESESL